MYGIVEVKPFKDSCRQSYKRN